jgi:hypothetical protein
MVEKVEGSIPYYLIFLKMDMWHIIINLKKQNGGLNAYSAMANSPTKYLFYYFII